MVYQPRNPRGLVTINDSGFEECTKQRCRAEQRPERSGKEKHDKLAHVEYQRMPTPMVPDLMSQERTQLLVVQSIETLFSENDPTRVTPPTGRFATQSNGIGRCHRGRNPHRNVRLRKHRFQPITLNPVNRRGSTMPHLGISLS